MTHPPWLISHGKGCIGLFRPKIATSKPVLVLVLEMRESKTLAQTPMQESPFEPNFSRCSIPRFAALFEHEHRCAEHEHEHERGCKKKHQSLYLSRSV
jgi:hypothetical protein